MKNVPKLCINSIIVKIPFPIARQFKIRTIHLDRFSKFILRKLLILQYNAYSTEFFTEFFLQIITRRK